MIVLEINQIEIDFCLQCKGSWLDAGELELILDGAENRDSLMASMEIARDIREAVHKCPICEKKMDKVWVGSEDQHRVIVDKCRNNDGLWFDEGELMDILDMGDFPCEPNVYELLNDVFGSEAQKDA
jgi:Zn-finger nucleic acid-binding protein